MKIKELFNKWKVHLMFGGGFLLVFLINAVINKLSGQTLIQAIVSTLRSIRPLDYLMFALFWYALLHKNDSDSRSQLTTLDLGSKI